MLFRPASLEEYAARSPHLQALFTVIGEMAAATREVLGKERLAWLRNLPHIQVYGPVAMVHASPDSLWVAPAPEARDAELDAVFGPLGKPVAVYAHIHRAFIRRLFNAQGDTGRIVANTGSVSLSYDGDRRAAYLLLDTTGPVVVPAIQRVEYDLAAEIRTLSGCGLPHAAWIAKTLERGRPEMP